MSRAGYSDDCDGWDLIRWRGQVASAIRGKRGQAFLREMLEALDAMPDKRLIAHDLIQTEVPAFVPPEFAKPCVCAIGSVGVKRGVDLVALDPENHGKLSDVFGMASPLVQEIEWMNDEGVWQETPQQRWQRMRAWVVKQLKEPVA
jgi:hypothetical protein